MATLTVNKLTRAGFKVGDTFVAVAAGGDKFANSGRESIVVFNGNAGSLTVTADIIEAVDGQAITDRTWTLATQASLIIGPFPQAYNDAGGFLNLTYSVSTGVLIFVLQIIPE